MKRFKESEGLKKGKKHTKCKLWCSHAVRKGNNWLGISHRDLKRAHLRDVERNEMDGNNWESGVEKKKMKGV